MQSPLDGIQPTSSEQAMPLKTPDGIERCGLTPAPSVAAIEPVQDKQTIMVSPYVKTVVPPGKVSFGPGYPSPRLVPIAMIRDAISRSLSDLDPFKMQYILPKGYPESITALSTFLTEHYGFPVRENELFLTNGAAPGLGLSVETFLPPGGSVFIENPTFFLIPLILRSTRPDVLLPSVALDEHGLRVDDLERQLVARTPEQAALTSILYCIPSFHNPAQCCLSTRRRCQLVRLARRHKLLIAADETYQLLEFGSEYTQPRTLRFFDQLTDEQLDTLAAQCRDDDELAAAMHVAAVQSQMLPPDDARIPPPCVLAIGTFSKILAPGLRLGWIHAHPALLKPIAKHGMSRSTGAVNPVTGVIAEVVKSGDLLRNIQTLRCVYGGRAHALTEALREYMPPGSCSFEEPRGGYFMWVKFPEWCDCTEMSEFAVPEGVEIPQITTPRCSLQEGWGVGFRPGVTCASDKASFTNYMRLCFAFYEEDELVVAVRRLATLYQYFAKSKGKI